MKQYYGEKAIISLTSWKARINTVGLTIFNLLQTCPGYHIVLVLSEEEFPKKEEELPANLRLMQRVNLFEILWVHENHKSFKKVLPTMNKYRRVPVISADDDCIYKYNYADELYLLWENNPMFSVSYYTTNYNGKCITGGYATLYPPHIFGHYTTIMHNEHIASQIIQNFEDDCLYACLRYKVGNNRVISLNKPFDEVAVIHDEITPLHDSYRNDVWKEHLDNMWAVISSI